MHSTAPNIILDVSYHLYGRFTENKAYHVVLSLLCSFCCVVKLLRGHQLSVENSKQTRHQQVSSGVDD